MTIYGELINHPSHPEHKLELKYEERPYRCDGCHQIGFGTRYRCDEPFACCNFHLHKECATPKDTITHPFFPGDVFHFLEKPDGPNPHCNACAQDIIGYNYHCFDRELDLHPCCAELPGEYSVEGGELKLRLKKKTSSKCYKCRTKDKEHGRKSWSYVSSGKECHLHIACVKEMVLDNWEKECLPARFGDRKEGMDVSDEKALARREPKLDIVIDKMKSRSGGKYTKYMKIVKIALTFIMAAVVGDPTALVIGLFSSLLTH